MSDFNYDLTQEQIDILIDECNHEIKKAKQDLTLMMIKRKVLQRKIEEWETEKEWFKLLRDGEKVENLCLITPSKTIKTIEKRYLDLMKKFGEINLEAK